jgi:hypothetical protein
VWFKLETMACIYDGPVMNAILRFTKNSTTSFLLVCPASANEDLCISGSSPLIACMLVLTLLTLLSGSWWCVARCVLNWFHNSPTSSCMLWWMGRVLERGSRRSSLFRSFNTVPYSITQHHTASHSTIQHHTAPYSITEHHTASHSVTQHHTAPYT